MSDSVGAVVRVRVRVRVSVRVRDQCERVTKHVAYIAWAGSRYGEDGGEGQGWSQGDGEGEGEPPPHTSHCFRDLEFSY